MATSREAEMPAPPPEPVQHQHPNLEPYSTFSLAMRTYLTYVLGFIITLSTLTATIYFPLIPLLSTQFRTSIQSINLTVTAYAIAQALSPALFASLADSPRIGRRPVMLSLIALYAAASLGLALNSLDSRRANGYVALMALRLLQSVAGSPAPALAGKWGIVAGGVWRTWWERLRGGSKNLASKSDCTHLDLMEKKKGWSLQDAVASFRIILHKDTFAVLWMVASSYSVYYTFQVAIPVIIDEIYGYNELEIGLVFLPGLAGMTIGGIIAGKLVDRNYAVTARKHGLELKGKDKHSTEFPIEAARYRHCLVFVFLQMILVIGYGWAVWFRVHPSVPIFLQFCACALSTLLSHTASALLVDIFPTASSSAYASGQLMRCGLSAASAAVLQPLVDAVGRGWYFTIFSLFVSVTGVGSVAVSQWRGMDWRSKRCAWSTGK
ncbi:MFS general substrate transporter [Canariomyces notabilis]|uniref:MFS general substrate transporter n=1 Tax=Canariomyces notabilis TaxID=2074819 RepID=A0AAN6YTT2_9PEZI|nr:MFS general substrate transporter [Canariomyces arenarius]